MKLKTDGTALFLEDDESGLTASYAEGGSRTGLLTLQHDDQTTTIRLDPWSPDGYEVHDWRPQRYLVLAGAKRLVVLDRETLKLKAAVWLEYEEAETIDRPWFVESANGQFLVVATDRRVWCIDERGAIRWCWSVRTRREAYFIYAAPLVVQQSIQVAIRSFRDERTILLDLDDGQEHVS